MSGVDKIYGTTDQYDEFYSWCKINKPQAIRYFYKRDDYEDDSYRPITNFPMWVDGWLLRNCNISWVVDRIREQYCLDKTQNYIEVSGDCVDDFITYDNVCEFCKKDFEFILDDDGDDDEWRVDDNGYQYCVPKTRCPFCGRLTRVTTNNLTLN